MDLVKTLGNSSCIIIEIMNFREWIGLGIVIVALITGAYFMGQNSTKTQFQLATDNNNPGLLKNSSGHLLTFNSPRDGGAALLNDIQAIMDGTTTSGLGPNSTLCDYASKYSFASGNSSAAQYCADLANQLHVSPATTIGSLRSRIGDFADAIANNNGFENR
jgi:hypothetical protein